MKPEKCILTLIGLFFILNSIILLSGINQSLFLKINSISTITGSWIWSNLTLLGDLLIVLVLMLPFCYNKPRMVWHAMLSVLIVILAVQLIKFSINTDRPVTNLPPDTFRLIGKTMLLRSFPSGHTATAFAFTGVLIYEIKHFCFRFLFLITAFLIGVSRIVVGAHWPIDICGGAILGLIGAWTVHFLIIKTPWGYGYRAQMIRIPILLITALVVLLVYNPKYPQSMPLQRVIAIICFAIGLIEYIIILSQNKHLRKNKELD